MKHSVLEHKVYSAIKSAELIRAGSISGDRSSAMSAETRSSRLELLPKLTLPLFDVVKRNGTDKLESFCKWCKGLEDLRLSAKGRGRQAAGRGFPAKSFSQGKERALTPEKSGGCKLR